MMKSKLLILFVLLGFIATPGFSQKKKKKSKDAATEIKIDSVKLVNRMDSISYSLGIFFGNNLSQNGFENLNIKVISQGIEEALSKKQLLLSLEAANELLNKYVVEKRNAKSNKNIEEGKAFLENNKKDTGVVVLPSGLQYKIIKAGNGEKPTINDKVTVHYHGTLIDGKVFDSSVERGEPIQLNVNGVIEGWKEALQLMPVGSKWKLFIPANLAYGENPMQGGPIEPNMVLVFDVELISINKE